jgi:signal transduction histidine kinase/ligand-binding sensor domain-containing protein
MVNGHRTPAARVLLVAFAQFTAFALDPTLRVSQYHKQYWQVEQGLPHSYVTAIAQNADGYLLVGTDEGLARFDGLGFKPLPADPSLRLSQRWVSALHLNRESNLWLGTFDGLLLEMRDGQVRKQYRIGTSVFDLREDPKGAVWVSTRNGVLRVDRNKPKRVSELGPPLETSWNVLSFDPAGHVWAVTGAGLFHESNDRIVRILANGGEHGDILTVLATRTRAVLIGTRRGLFRLAPDNATAPIRIRSVPGPVVSLFEDHDGVIWAGTWGEGLIRLAGEGVDRWTSRDGLPEDFIRTLAEDAEGNLWIGMRAGGLGRWTDSRLIPVGPPEGLAGSFATTVAAGPGGDLWLGTWRGGLYRLRNGTLEPQPTPVPTPVFAIRAIATDPAGHPWIGNWEGLVEFDGTRYRRFAAEADSPYGRVSALLFDRRGGLWVGTADRGLFLFPAGHPSDPPPPALIPDAEITALLEDSVGAIWVGTAKGLVKFPDAASPVATDFKAIPAAGISSIFEDSQKRIWFPTSDGNLAVISGSRLHILDRKNGLPGHPLYRILEAADHSFWVSSPKGILELPAGSVEPVLAAKRTVLDIIVHGQEDGMRTIECHGLSQPSGWKDRNGNLWFPTAKGFIQVRATASQQLPPPKPFIEAVTTGDGPLPLASEISLKPGARNVGISFTGLRFSNPRSVHFRYLLSDYDPDWVDAGTSRAARYNQIPRGAHRFEVQARDSLGPWSASASLDFRQQPRYYETWWFLLSLGLVAGSLMVLIYRWRLYTVHERYALVLDERNRIGREWHDTLVAGFSAISLQLEAAMARVKEHPERAAEILEVTRKMVHHYRAEARRVIWDLRDNRPEGETLSAAVEDALARVKDNHGIEGQVTITGDAVPLPLELQHNVQRICQEAVANAARHGRPSRVDVHLAFTPNCLTASIRDDGCGFAPHPTAETPGHFGLTVMQERARRHGGRLHIESRAGAGTLVEAVIPIGGAKSA